MPRLVPVAILAASTLGLGLGLGTVLSARHQPVPLRVQARATSSPTAAPVESPPPASTAPPASPAPSSAPTPSAPPSPPSPQPTKAPAPPPPAAPPASTPTPAYLTGNAGLDWRSLQAPMLSARYVALPHLQDEKRGLANQAAYRAYRDALIPFAQRMPGLAGEIPANLRGYASPSWSGDVIKLGGGAQASAEALTPVLTAKTDAAFAQAETAYLATSDLDHQGVYMDVIRDFSPCPTHPLDCR